MDLLLASLLLTVGEAINLLRETIHFGETLDSRVVIARARNVLSAALLLAGRDGKVMAGQALAGFEQMDD